MRRLVTCLVALCFASCGLVTSSPRPAAAHGIQGHVHVTGWAIENLPDGELRDFFSEPEVLQAALFGAAFTDSGYWPRDPEIEQAARAYGEHTHWEPFIEDFIVWIRVNDPPPWDSLESRKRVAFMMGCAAHGLQDEIFDSLFLDQVGLHDGAGQDESDPATDGFLALDGHLRFVPPEYVPMETLLELYAPLDAGVTAEVIDAGVDTMTYLYVNDDIGPELALSFGEQYADQLPWTREHYLTMDVPGSLRSEILPTAAYLQAIWERVHGRAPDDLAGLVTYTFPAPPRRLRSHTAGTPDSRVTLLFGAGVRYDSVAPAWHDAGDTPVPFTLRNTRWGGTWPRLVRLDPDADLSPGAWYRASLADGLERIDGRLVGDAAAWALDFQVACTPDDQSACPDLGELPVPSIEDPNPPPPPADESDVVEPAPDAGDTTTPPDEMTDDTGGPVSEDAATDAPVPPRGDDGCGCRIMAASQPTPVAAALGLLLLGLLGRVRRRSRAQG